MTQIKDGSAAATQKGYYDSKADIFERGFFFGRKNRNHLKKIDKICELLELEDRDYSILEVGVGTGIHASRLLGQHHGVRYNGIDVSEKMIKRARDALKQLGVESKAALLVGDGCRLPFKDSSFDAAYISGSLHHFPEPQLGLLELVRVVKPGGKIAVMEPNWLFPTNLLAGLTNDVERNILKMSKQNFAKWVSDLEIEKIEIRNYIYTPPIPAKLANFYEIIDDLCPRIPLISEFSIMIYLVGSRKECYDRKCI